MKNKKRLQHQCVEGQRAGGGLNAEPADLAYENDKRHSKIRSRHAEGMGGAHC